MTKRGNKRISKEFIAIHSHYRMLRGLAFISGLRVRMFIDAIEAHRLDPMDLDDQVRAIRQTVREVASVDPKARMALDLNREIDLYVWGPMQLFFCVAYAFVERYRLLKREYPNLGILDLDRYIQENRAGFEAIEKLRNWVLHPGYSRKPDDAMEMLFAAGGPQGNAYPQEMMNRLLLLIERFLERLHAETG